MITPQQDPCHHDRPAPAATPVPVLILDDERVDRYRMARLCSGLGFPCEVRNAKTLGEFGSLLARDRFSLILVDYSLPDGDGLEALEMVRLSPRNLNAPTVMITGMDAYVIRERAFAEGCAGFLSKDDLTPDRFATAINKVMGTNLSRPRARDSYPRAEVEELLSLCATGTSRVIKPRVSRLMRQIRDMRRGDLTDPATTLSEIESTCMGLWHFLIERERDEGPHHLADLLEGNGADPQAKPPTLRPVKPPSPFRSRRH